MNIYQTLTPDMIGRQTQLQELIDSLDRANAGSGQLVFVAGEAGIGKTRLLCEFVRNVRTRSEIDLLEGNCYDEDPVPYGPFIDMMRSVVRRDGIAAVAERAGPWVADLARLLPELASFVTTENTENDAQMQKRRLFEAIYQIIKPQDTECRVLLLEDLHWSDQTSQELILYISRTMARERMLLLGTYRTDELHRRHPLTHLIAQLTRDRFYREVQLAALSPAETTRLIETTLNQRTPQAFISAIYARAEGNPFFIEEMVRALIEQRKLDHMIETLGQYPTNEPIELPLSIKDSVVQRIIDLDPVTSEMLQYAAVIGRQFDFDLLLQLLNIEEDQLVQALTQLIERQLIVEDHGSHHDRYRFRHELTREAIYSDLLGRERRIKHREVLQTLETMHPADQEKVLDQLAYHSLHARELAKAAHYAQLAGDRAARMYAFREAVSQYEMALENAECEDTLERAGLYDKLGKAAHALSDTNRAMRAWREAHNLYRQCDQRITAAHIWQQLGRVSWIRGDKKAAFTYTKEALAQLEQEPPGIELAMAYSAMSALYMLTYEQQESIEWGEKALQLADELGDPSVKPHALNNIGCSLVELGKDKEGIDYLYESLALSKELGTWSDTVRAYHNLGVHLTELGHFQRALAVVEEGIDFAQKFGLESSIGTMPIKMGHIKTMLGDWDEALHWYDYVERTLGWGSNKIAFYSAIEKSRLLLAQGRIDETELLLEPFVASGSPSNESSYILLVLAQIALIRGNVDEAISQMTRCIEALNRQYKMPEIAHFLSVGADIYLKADAMDQAADLFNLIEPHLHQSPENIFAHTHFENIQGMLATKQKRYVEAIQHFRQALTRWQEMELPYEEAQTRQRLAECLFQTNDTDATIEAQRELTTARDIFERLGAPLDLMANEAIAQRFDTRRRSNTPRGRTNGLTRRERQVIALIAQGLSNREIAETLVISEKTAEVHVSNILGKLHFTSRAQAAAYAVEQGLTGGG
ncbi:MAG: AAA family ATPase [Chloroflexota bacterium]